nr:hypothetical protein [Tanacetum cinerariifolium]
MPWLEPSLKTLIDGVRLTPQETFLSAESPPPHHMVPENAKWWHETHTFQKEMRSILPVGDTSQFISSKDVDIAII